MSINKSVEDIREYQVASHEVWNALPEERKLYLKLDWNESTIPPSPKVRNRIVKLFSLDDFYNLYPKTLNDELQTKLADYSGVKENNILYFPSSDSLHEYICRVYLNDHCRILILSPSYDNFRLTAESIGAEVIYSDNYRNGKLNCKLFEQDLVNYHPSMVYICNPNNPTGNQIEPSYIEYLLKRFSDTVFLVDEAYWEFSGITCKNYIQSYENLLITRTMSKAFGLANFRFGYLISNEKNIKIVSKIRNPKNISTFTQEAVLGALDDIQYMRNYVHEVNLAKEYFYNELLKYKSIIKPYKSSANFIMVQFNSKEHESEVYKKLKEWKIYIRECTQRPYLNRCVRITIGTRKQMEYTAEKLGSIFNAIELRG